MKKYIVRYFWSKFSISHSAPYMEDDVKCTGLRDNVRQTYSRICYFWAILILTLELSV